MSDLEINNDCWSLIAVVRECSRKANFKPLTPPPDCSELATTRAATPFNGGATQNCFLESPNSLSVAAHDIAATDGSWFDELINLYKPFMARYSTSDASYNDVTLPPRPPLPDQVMQRGCFLNRKLGSCSIGASHHQTISMKKNKDEEKSVCKVSGEDLSSDKWAWRKYGQKPIKGSPYPRNYYRCSSYKGCGARKQVERSPIDPNIYIVTYAGHHHHSRPTPRNTLGDRVKLSVTHPLDNPGSPETASSSNHSGSGSGDFETKIDPNTLADSDPMMGIEQLMKGSDPDEDWRIGLRGGNE